MDMQMDSHTVSFVISNFVGRLHLEATSMEDKQKVIGLLLILSQQYPH